MKMNKLNLVIPLVLALLLALPLVVASGETFTVTITQPANNGRQSGNVGNLACINISIWQAEANTSAYNCTFYAKSASTANSSWTMLRNGSNISLAYAGNVTFINLTNWNSTFIEDSNDYIINVSCKDNNTIVESDTNTGIEIDNTVPTAPSALSPGDHDEDTDGDVSFSATVTDSETTGCTLYIGPVGGYVASYAMTYSTTSCTKSLTGLLNNVYDWYVKASDGTNTTNSASYQLEISETVSSVKKKYYGEVGVSPVKKVYLAITETEILGLPLLGFIGILVVVIAIIILATRKKTFYRRK